MNKKFDIINRNVLEKLINLYRQWRGESPVHIEKLQMAGSNREYYRMADADGATVIGVIGTSRDENRAFIYLSGHFTRLRLPVPQILAAYHRRRPCPLCNGRAAGISP